MKGRSPYNKPEIRRKELLHYLLDKEKVRWKTVKDDFRKRKWGPSTLKTYLDRLCEKGLVYIDVKHGPRGPEVWYCISIKKAAEDLFKMQKKAVETKDMFTVEELEKAGSSLRTAVFPKMFHLYMAQFINYFFLTALAKYRNMENRNIDRLLQTSSEYFYDVSFKKGFQKLLNFALAFPEDTQVAIAGMLGREELKAWVEKRELEIEGQAKIIISETDATIKKLTVKLLHHLKERLQKTKSKDEYLLLEKLISELSKFRQKV